MYLLARDYDDNSIHLLKVIEMCYESREETIYVYSHMGVYTIPNVKKIDYENWVTDFYRSNKIDLTQLDYIKLYESDD